VVTARTEETCKTAIKVMLESLMGVSRRSKAVTARRKTVEMGGRYRISSGPYQIPPQTLGSTSTVRSYGTANAVVTDASEQSSTAMIDFVCSIPSAVVNLESRSFQWLVPRTLR
jgi:hypothetical protein